MINESNFPVEAGCREDGMPDDLGNFLEGFGIDEVEIVDGKIIGRICEQDFSRGIQKDIGVLFSGDLEVSCGSECLPDPRSIGSLGIGEPGVAGGEGQSVLLTNGGMTDDADGEIEIADHAPDDGELLEIFFSEDRKFGLKDIEEFQDDGENAIKVTGAGFPAEMFGQKGLGDENRAIRVIKVGALGDKGDFHSFGLAFGQILLKGAGVVVQITGPVKLDGIDKDGNDDRSLGSHLPPGFPDQGKVTLVKRSHRGDERDGAGKLLQRGSYRVDVWDTCDHLTKCR